MSAKLMCLYSEWLSGNAAWKYQERAPQGATVLGAGLATDKTQLTSMTGNVEAYPALITIANLDMEFRMKVCHHAFLLLALLPVAKFLEKNSEIRGVLVSRLFHAIMDFILEPLKKTAEIGQMMTTAERTLFQLEKLEETLHPWVDLAEYVKESKKAEPAIFLTPEILHYWLKFFYDHLVKWCIQALGTVSKRFLKTIASLNSFFYHGQAPLLSEDVLKKMDNYLQNFHGNKQAIMNAGARRGKKGCIENSNLPKVSGLLSVMFNVRLNGAPLQWTADVTDHAHITLVKRPAANTNNHAHEEQIVRTLDRQDKMRCFDLATAMTSAGVAFGTTISNSPGEDANFPEDTILDDEPPLLLNNTSELLARIEPIIIGGKRPTLEYLGVPFEKIEYWDKVKIQLCAFHDSQKILIPETVNAVPPNETWKPGRADAVIVNHDSQLEWPGVLQGHTVCQLRMVFRAVPVQRCRLPAAVAGFMVYVERFDIIPQQDPAGPGKGAFPDPASRMYQLRRGRRADRTPKGDIVPLHHLRVPVEITPHFGKKANPRLTKETSLDYAEIYWLSKWFNKELFYALDQ
ncbi:hypothetical protein K438DRAFT_1786655 [Mycena galopus ATCC 62051]|nr:hypothetical protein K438DRAFT_1786655 [Mycena galopus ATCC 62051]